MALGILGQKLKASYTIQGEGEHVLPRHPGIPLELRVGIEREARRMAGYWHGNQIAESFLNIMTPGNPQQTEQDMQVFLNEQDDPAAD